MLHRLLRRRALTLRAVRTDPKFPVTAAALLSKPMNHRAGCSFVRRLRRVVRCT
jgi:hypothetical protein